MESTRPLAHCRVVVSGSQDPVEYFVRAKDDGRTVMPAQSETRTGWLMSPVTLRSQLRRWMRAEQVALRCLLASRPSRWLIVKGIQEHSFPEGVFCWVFRTLQCLLHWAFSLVGGRSFATSWTPVEGRVMGKHAHRFGVGAPRTCSALRRRHNSPLQDENNVLSSLPAMNGLLVIYFGCFCRITSLKMVTRDVWLQSLSAAFFLTGGVEELQALADVIAGCKGRCFSHPKYGCWEDVFHSCGGGRHR
ncbi:hypothetical protein TcBrA4_0011160 [Trypanosoma cruzi]|nr:hypothetical protein TcBrA4_0011160 [Trypanosoma cruzi]